MQENTIFITTYHPLMPPVSKIIKNCNNVFDLIKLEAICILLRKPVLCKQKDFDYTVSLFS